MTEYTPTTAVVRGTYAVAWDSVTDRADIKEVRNQATAEFNRWLETERAEAKAEALNQAADEITRLNHDVEMYDENLDATPVNVWLQRRAAQYREGK